MDSIGFLSDDCLEGLPKHFLACSDQRRDETVSKEMRLKNMNREAHLSWTLTDRDRDTFVNALLNPPAPSDRLKAAVARYLDAKPQAPSEQQAKRYSTQRRRDSS